MLYNSCFWTFAVVNKEKHFINLLLLFIYLDGMLLMSADALMVANLSIHPPMLSRFLFFGHRNPIYLAEIHRLATDTQLTYRQTLAGCPAFQADGDKGLAPVFRGIPVERQTDALFRTVASGAFWVRSEFWCRHSTYIIPESTSVLYLKSRHTFDRSGKQGSHRQLVTFIEAYETRPFILILALPKILDYCCD
jgi:hypothetical protein